MPQALPPSTFPQGFQEEAFLSGAPCPGLHGGFLSLEAGAGQALRDSGLGPLLAPPGSGDCQEGVSSVLCLL